MIAPAPQQSAHFRPVLAPAASSAVIVRGDRPHLGWIEIDRLFVDDRYQRPLGQSNWQAIRQIADRFDWALFSTVDVAPMGGGQYAIIDGQHRVHAAAIAGIDKVPCRIVLLMPADQARAFSAINGQVTAISAFHIYRAALAAGEAWAVKAKAVAEDAGCKLMTSNASTKDKRPGEVYAVAWIRRIVEAGEMPCCCTGAALRALLLSDEGGSQAEFWSVHFLGAWQMAVSWLDEWCQHPAAAQALAVFLNEAGIAKLVEAADASRIAARRAGGKVQSVRTLLIQELSEALDQRFPDKRSFVVTGEGAS